MNDTAFTGHGQSEQPNKETIASEFVLLARVFLEKLQVPQQDIEKNAKVLFAETVSKMNLVTRDELERQHILLKQAQSELAAMKEKVTQLERVIATTTAEPL